MMLVKGLLENLMALPAKPEPAPDALPPDPYEDYRPVYAWVFQSWLIMFLVVICIALIFYLYPHIVGIWH